MRWRSAVLSDGSYSKMTVRRGFATSRQRRIQHRKDNSLLEKENNENGKETCSAHVVESSSSFTLSNKRNDDATNSTTISVDTSGLLYRRPPPPEKGSAHVNELEKWKGYEFPTPLSSHLSQLIGARGAISVAEYMRQALTHPASGYYESSSDVIGASGDFTTAPEISQIFGECLAVWSYATYQQIGSPDRLILVELGPGKGTLMEDVIRTAANSFPGFLSALAAGGGIHLVERSDVMRRAQFEKLGCVNEETGNPFEEDSGENGGNDGASKLLNMSGIPIDENGGVEKKAENEIGAPSYLLRANMLIGDSLSIPVTWHMSLHSVPIDTEVPQITLAQEFLDALPVHIFEKVEEGKWSERLVDVVDPLLEAEVAIAAGTEGDVRASRKDNASKIKKPRFRFVLSPSPTPAMRTLLKTDEQGKMMGKHAAMDDAAIGDVLEVGAESMAHVQDLALRIQKCNGAALIIDYGSDQGTGDSLRAFSKHKQIHALSFPGKVDITADVDFRSLVRAVESSAWPLSCPTDCNGETSPVKVQAFGPVNQGNFLAALGAVERVQTLIDCDSTTEEQATDLYMALERLLSYEKPHMGSRFKVLSIARVGPKSDTKPIGF